MSKLLSRFRNQRNGQQEQNEKWGAYGDFFYRMFRILRAVLAIIAGVSMIAEYGFHLHPAYSEAGHQLRVYILNVYFILSLFQILTARNIPEYIRRRKGESLLLLFIGVYLVFPDLASKIALSVNPNLTPVAVTNVYLVASQVFLLLALIFNWVRFSSRLTNYRIHPPALLMISFLFLIMFGAGLLSLPKATHSAGMPFLDALFTSASAVCVTGLTVVDTGSYFTFTGQLIILFLIQLGGLGIMTLTTFISVILGNAAQLKEYATLKDMLDEESTGKIRQTVLVIVLMTVIIESIGAISIYYSIDPAYLSARKDKIYFAVFHSVSAFCNAGFSLDPAGLAHVRLASNNLMLFTIMTLIVLGGLGFPVMSNIGRKLNPLAKHGFNRRRLSLHSKIVLLSTLILLASGLLLIYILESGRILAGMSFTEGFIASLFQSVTLRTAGFNTVNFSALAEPTLFIMVLYMWIGASPGSTGGGIKTTTFTVALLNLVSLGRGRRYVELWGREIPQVAVIKAFATIILSVFFISLAIFTMMLAEPDKEFMALLFEVVSAFSTVGLTTGITTSLSPAGKSIIITMMFLGRIGLLTFLFTFLRHRSEGKYRYSEEHIII
ncbi:MAG: hypothetical protein FMNOHCHN_02686 [Ignavibacteriaceae bacterium]|nr:hypothetical protein [Ignavibacteriaceae bacterium]